MEDEFWYKKRREARAAALKKELDERNARIKRSLFYYIKQNNRKDEDPDPGDSIHVPSPYPSVQSHW